MSEIVNIPDVNFRNYILIKLKKPTYYQITKEDCESILEIFCDNSEIKTLDGIEYFTNLTVLFCHNNQLTNLNLSKNIELTNLDCVKNQLSNLDLNKNVKLTSLVCYNNNLTSLDLRNNILLTYLECDKILLRCLDLSKNTNLKNCTIIANQF